MELNLTPETLKKWAAVLALLATVGLGVYALMGAMPGCAMVETFFAPSLSALKLEAEAKTGSTAEALRMVDSGDETDGVADEETVIYSWEVWEVAVTLDNPWSGAEQMNHLFVQVSNEEGEWKFVRILFDEEAQRYAEEQSDVQ